MQVINNDIFCFITIMVTKQKLENRGSELFDRTFFWTKINVHFQKSPPTFFPLFSKGK